MAKERLAGIFAGAVAIVLAAAVGPTAPAARATEGVVTPRGTFSSLFDALAGAVPGERLDVYGGVHAGPITIDRPVQLIGHDRPVIDGPGQGTVVSIEAPGVTVQGFEIRGTGVQLVHEDAAIEVNAPDALIEDNHIREALFGVYLREAHRSVVRDNEIVGMSLEPARRGDAIRIWSSHDAVVEGNRVVAARDVVLWYSADLVVRDNEVTGGRYGLHFMYCDDARVENNRLVDNSVGAFLMYSRRLQLSGNVIAENRGPSGYGIGLKDVDDAVIDGNLFADNRVGAYIDNSPRELDSTIRFTSNSFVLNDFGLRLMPSVHDNEFSGNSFIHNIEQVEAAGGGNLGANRWAVDGAGNYWSDYNGYDANGDGYGDMAYRSDRLFDRLTDQDPVLRILMHSPSVQAIDFGTRVAPFTKPEPKLTDAYPSMSSGNVTGLTVHSERSTAPLLISSAGLLGVALIVGMLAVRTPRGVIGNNSGKPLDVETAQFVNVRQVSKKYGSNRVLDDVTFQVRKGECLAIWGPNGAGKTTAVRCLLGVTEFSGSIAVGGQDVRTRGKSARKLIGFVPQETGFAADTSIEDTLAFFSSLRRAQIGESNFLITQLGLEEHRKKRVRELSGGLRQRLAIAVALLGDPPLLVMDEPTANLDAAGRDDVLAVLQRLRKDGKSLILASHRPEEIAVLADRVLVMEKGRIVEDVPASSFVSRNVRSVILRLTVEGEVAEGAVKLLNQHGFSAIRSLNQVIVKVGSRTKAAPMAALSKAGFDVVDFEFSGPAEEGRDA